MFCGPPGRSFRGPGLSPLPRNSTTVSLYKSWPIIIIVLTADMIFVFLLDNWTVERAQPSGRSKDDVATTFSLGLRDEDDSDWLSLGDVTL